jgi:anti-sigma-K factor RskA
MNTPLNSGDDSQLHWETMRYLLEDPALDCNEFEARLANDHQLAEVLAESVATFQLLKSLGSEAAKSASIRANPVVTLDRALQASESSRPQGSHRNWNLIACIAASISFIGFLSWMIFETNRIAPIEHELLIQNPVAIKNIVSAWSELQLDDESNTNADLIVDSSYSEEDLTLVAHDTFSEKDVPEWLVMATVDSLENNIEANDTKVLLQ